MKVKMGLALSPSPDVFLSIAVEKGLAKDDKAWSDGVASQSLPSPIQFFTEVSSLMSASERMRSMRIGKRFNRALDELRRQSEYMSAPTFIEGFEKRMLDGLSKRGLSSDVELTFQFVSPAEHNFSVPSRDKWRPGEVFELDDRWGDENSCFRARGSCEQHGELLQKSSNVIFTKMWKDGEPFGRFLLVFNKDSSILLTNIYMNQATVSAWSIVDAMGGWLSQFGYRKVSDHRVLNLYCNPVRAAFVLKGVDDPCPSFSVVRRDVDFTNYVFLVDNQGIFVAPKHLAKDGWAVGSSRSVYPFAERLFVTPIDTSIDGSNIIRYFYDQSVHLPVYWSSSVRSATIVTYLIQDTIYWSAHAFGKVYDGFSTNVSLIRIAPSRLLNWLMKTDCKVDRKGELMEFVEFANRREGFELTLVKRSKGGI